MFCFVFKAYEELEDALGREQRTAQIRAEIERRRWHRVRPDDILSMNQVAAPIDSYALDYWPPEMNYDPLIVAEQQMLQQQLLHQEQHRRQAMTALRATQSLVDDPSAHSASYLMSNGHRPNEFLNQTRAPLLHETTQSRSLDVSYDMAYAYPPNPVGPLIPCAPQYPYLEPCKF